MIYKIQILSHGYIPYLNKKGPIIKPIEVNEIGLKKLQKIYSEDKIKIIEPPSKIKIKEEDLKEKLDKIKSDLNSDKKIEIENPDYVNQYNSYIENVKNVIETTNSVLETIANNSILGEDSNNNEAEEVKPEENETMESNIEENNEEESEDDTENTDQSNSENNYNGRKRRKKR